MHVFLTGEMKIGKSTALKKALEKLNLPYDGFFTAWQGDILYMSAASGSRKGFPMAERNSYRAKVFPGAFDLVGPKLLSGSGDKLTIMDELGFLESGSRKFTSEVTLRLSKKVPVLGVLRDMDTAFLNGIRRRDDVTVLVVTVENRDDIPSQIVKLIKDQLERNIR